ncbi:MAG TPA: helix-hairpin-helix domain-containing protein [Acidisarcina sp.]|nr:helix-hairpin-helix domain-containing protein [Acidisarcina sp.]
MHEPPRHLPRFVFSRTVYATALAFAFLALAFLSPAGEQELAAQSINDQPPARIVRPPAPQVDINRATIAQLTRVHGITPSYAQRIINGRPYANKGQLKTKAILPPQVYDAVKDRLIAHHIH